MWKEEYKSLHTETGYERASEDEFRIYSLMIQSLHVRFNIPLLKVPEYSSLKATTIIQELRLELYKLLAYTCLIFGPQNSHSLSGAYRKLTGTGLSTNLGAKKRRELCKNKNSYLIKLHESTVEHTIKDGCR